MPLDLNRPVQTRDGRKARIICTNRESINSVVALVTRSDDGTEDCLTYTADGHLVEGREGQPADLVNVPERLTGWVNLYPVSTSTSWAVYAGGLYATREEADDRSGSDRIGVAYIDTEKLA